MRLYIVPGAPTLLYQQGNQNLCMLLSLGSALRYMGDLYASEYIIRHKQKSWQFRINVECTSAVIFLWKITKKKRKKDSIIVLSNGIHPRHMIYFGIIVIPILKWRFHLHRIAQIIHVVVITLMRLNLLVYYMRLEQSLLKLFKED